MLGILPNIGLGESFFQLLYSLLETSGVKVTPLAQRVPFELDEMTPVKLLIQPLFRILYLLSDFFALLVSRQAVTAQTIIIVPAEIIMPGKSQKYLL